MKVVVDTNVAAVANGHSAQASTNCVVTCVEHLQRITNGMDQLVLDDQWRIIGEYQNNLHSGGQPGVGDAFLKWVLTNRTNQRRCEHVSITPVNKQETTFEEFPADPALKDFDPSDRKFVAVALAHPKRPPIWQAVDSEWWACRGALERNGVTIEFVCEDDIRQLQR